MDPTVLTQQRPIDMGPRLDEGPTPLSAISGDRPPQADFLSTLFKDYSRTPDRPLSSPVTAAEPQRGSMSPFEAGARNAPFPLAPESARMLAGPPGMDASSLPRSLENPPASSSFGGRPSPLPFTPRTTDQQLRGLSPFAELGSRGPTRVAGDRIDNLFGGLQPSTLGTMTADEEQGMMDLAKALSNSDLPKHIARPGTELYPQFGSPNDPRQMPPYLGEPMGLNTLFRRPSAPPVDAVNRMGEPMGGYPTPPQPNVREDVSQAAPVSPVANAPNLSPFEQWPPPWWNFGGGDFGGGGGFGGGYDFGAFG
jgi:hypothetical protein